MTLEQRTARNEAYQLIKIASRLLSNVGLTAYADEAAQLAATMSMDAKMLLEQEKRRQGVA